jgi:hypothetical protein
MKEVIAMSNWMENKVIVEGQETPHDPITMVRRIAASIEEYWGPVAARSFTPTGEIDTSIAARDDALCLRGVADMMEKNRGS